MHKSFCSKGKVPPHPSYILDVSPLRGPVGNDLAFRIFKTKNKKPDKLL